MDWIIGILVFGVAVFLAAYLLPGVSVRHFGTALIVALLLTIVNGTIGWIFKIITFPFAILTLGISILLINALMVKIVDWIVPGFKVKHFGWAIVFSIVVSIISFLLNWIFR